LHWQEAREQVHGFPRMDHATFSSQTAAEAFVSAIPKVQFAPLSANVVSMFTDGSVW